MQNTQDRYESIGLFGLLPGFKGIYLTEVIRSQDTIIIERTVSLKTHTLTVAQAKLLAESILTLCKD